MILDMFIVLILISIAFIVIGVYIKVELFSIIGFLFLACLGLFVVLSAYTSTPNYLQYQNGYNITTSGSSTIVQPIYVTWADNMTLIVGWTMSLLGLFSAIFLYWIHRKGDRE